MKCIQCQQNSWIISKKRKGSDRCILVDGYDLTHLLSTIADSEDQHQPKPQTSQSQLTSEQMALVMVLGMCDNLTKALLWRLK